MATEVQQGHAGSEVNEGHTRPGLGAVEWVGSRDGSEIVMEIITLWRQGEEFLPPPPP